MSHPQSVPDPYDYSPLHTWTFRFTQAEMDSRLGPHMRGRLREVQVTTRGDSSRMEYARLIGTGGPSTIRGDTLAAALGLYDRWALLQEGEMTQSSLSTISSGLPLGKASSRVSAIRRPRAA